MRNSLFSPRASLKKAVSGSILYVILILEYPTDHENLSTARCFSSFCNAGVFFRHRRSRRAPCGASGSQPIPDRPPTRRRRIRDAGRRSRISISRLRFGRQNAQPLQRNASHAVGPPGVSAETGSLPCREPVHPDKFRPSGELTSATADPTLATPQGKGGSRCGTVLLCRLSVRCLFPAFEIVTGSVRIL